ncbi:MAG: hypothetical protein ACLFV6_14630, partial [Spirulinaceae cyanobacterium]
MKLFAIAYFLNGILLGVNGVTLIGLIYRALPVAREVIAVLTALTLLTILMGIFLTPAQYRLPVSILLLG